MMNEIIFIQFFALTVIERWRELHPDSKRRPTKNGVFTVVGKEWEHERIPPLCGHVPSHVDLFDRDVLVPLEESGYIHRMEGYEGKDYHVYEIALTGKGTTLLVNLRRICGKHWSHWPLTVSVEESGTVEWSNAQYLGDDN